MAQAKLAGLPASFVPHCLRHMFVSACLGNGIPITDVSRWVGHSSIDMTHRIYGHMLKSATARAVEILDREWQQAA
jgi:integrase